MKVMEVELRQPDDWHVHLREGAMLEQVIPFTSRVFARALVMPNTSAPIESERDAGCYRSKILAAAGGVEHTPFNPRMTVKLTSRTRPEMFSDGRMLANHVVAAKLYPTGVTTNAEDGVSNVEELLPVFTEMQKSGIVLCVHAEEPGGYTLDREDAYLRRIDWIHTRAPGLKIVIEHVTTKTAVDYVRASGPSVAATITVHHLYLTLDDVIGDRLRPHNFCKPIAKTKEDRRALQDVALGAHERFFLGTDSAPHAVGRKECDHGCAGCFTAPHAMELLAHLWSESGQRFDTLEDFTSSNGAEFYGVPRNKGKLVLRRAPWRIPSVYGAGETAVVPFMAGEQLGWTTSLGSP